MHAVLFADWTWMTPVEKRNFLCCERKYGIRLWKVKLSCSLIILGQRLDTLDACLLSALVLAANDYPPPNPPGFTDEVCRQDFLANRDRLRGLVRLRADDTNFTEHLPVIQVVRVAQAP